jgi:hypothetical protein
MMQDAQEEETQDQLMQDQLTNDAPKNGAFFSEEAQAATDVQEAIRRRAYEIFQERGTTPGSEVEDWLQAKAEILEAQEVRGSDSLENVRPGRKAA